MAEQKPWEAYAAPASAPAAASTPSDKPWLAYAAPASVPATTPAAEPLTPSQRALGGMALMAGGLAKSPADVALSAARGAVAMPVSGLAGLAGTVLPGPPGQGAAWQQATQQTIQGEPLTLGGKAAMQGMGMQMEPAIEAARAPGGRLAEAGYPAAGAIVSGLPEATLAAIGAPGRVGAATRAPFTLAGEQLAKGAQVVGRGVQRVRGAMEAQQAGAQKAAQQAGMQQTQTFGRLSASAAQVPTAQVYAQALANSSPQLRAMVSRMEPGSVNDAALNRHIEADSLGINLTRGQATGDLQAISTERNMRGKNPKLAEAFRTQNEQLKSVLPEFREQITPDVYVRDTTAAGEGLISAYQAFDEARTGAIRQAYQTLQDMNAGQFPVDPVAMFQRARANLAQQLKSEFLAPAIESQIKRFEEGAPMNFEQFEALRTNLATEMRKGGNEATAAGIVRQAMDELPLPPGVSPELKTAADTARRLARERFQDLESDQAYKAVVDGRTRADKFVQRYVVNASPEQLRLVAQKFGSGPEAQLMRAGVVNYLSDISAGRGEYAGFSQAAYNKVLKNMEARRTLDLVFPEEMADRLRTIGNVANYVQGQPVGSWVNNSNSLVAAIANYGVKGITDAIDAVTRVPIASTAARAVGEGLETRRALEPFAGLKRE